ncbi:pentatricopeptide repeat-containing protein At5g56310 [Aristolochia californica]|uniref:pentatricopeptide repeat-containing protein At5g56310 n=1 Tax=Aristolochia californica TaxID=171875 RepID=UPI0035D5760E
MIKCLVHTTLRILLSSPLKLSFSVSHCSSVHTLPDKHGLLARLKQCSTFKHINEAYGFMVSRGLDQDNLFLSKFLETCSSLGLARFAFSIFTRNIRPDIYLYNTMIQILSQTEYAKDAILLYTKLHILGFRPDTYSFPFVLKAVTHLTALEVGREIHAQVIRIGFDSDPHVATGLIQMYSTCRIILDARHLFDEMCYTDLISWNAMVAGYVKNGDLDTARALFEQMSERNVITWTTIIAGYAQTNRSEEAISMFQRMQLANIEPDEIAMLAALSACAQLGALELGEWIHNCIDKQGLFRIVPLTNALIDMYAKSGNIGKALKVFENMRHRSVITWTTMIAGLALHGLGVEALEMFSRMERARVKPNDVTFIAILSACSHFGLVDLGRCYFNIMNSRYHIKPKIEHYGCLIDLLGRAGFLEEAQELVRTMPFEANGAIWGSLLAASRIHGSVELGEYALRHLIEVEPHNSGNYTLLSNIYAAREKWDAVGKVRKMMRDSGVKKSPGGSSIEVNGAVHNFIAGDKSHLLHIKIYEVLYVINYQLKLAGYVPKIWQGPLDLDEG